MSNESNEFVERDPVAGFTATPGTLTGPLGEGVTPLTDGAMIAAYHAARQADTEPAGEVEHEPNLVFVGRQPNPKFVDEESTPGEKEFVCLEPVLSFTDGHHVISIPDDIDQKKPFYHAEARRIRRIAPKLYADPSDPAASRKGCCGEGE